MAETDTRPAFALPHEVVVAGLRYHVEVVESLDEYLGPGALINGLAYTHTGRGIIRIRGAGSQSEDQARDSLLHEVIHAVSAAVDIDLEERQVTALSTCLLDTIRRNPELALALVSK